MKYTTSDLIEILKKFPKNCPIETELALMWNYPRELRNKFCELTDDEFRDITMKHATNLFIFEGDWNKGVSDLEGRLK